MTAAGPEVARSAAGTSSEIVLIPTAFSDATWTLGGSPETAVATWQRGEEQESVEVHVGSDGRLLGVLMQRWGGRTANPSEDTRSDAR